MARDLVNAIQQSGCGVDARVRATGHTLFFALWPEDAVRAQMEVRTKALDRQHHPHGRLLKPERYHLTLQFLGGHTDIPPQLVEDAMSVAGRVRTPAFDLSLDQAGSFQKVWWLGSAQPPAGLEALWQALDADPMHAWVKGVSPDGFIAHVTVVRDATTRLPPTPISPIVWRVRGFVLIDSQPPRPYAILHRWRLQDAE